MNLANVRTVTSAICSMSLALAFLLPRPAEAGHQGQPVAGERPMVDCLLPGQIRRLSRDVHYVTPPRLVRIAAGDCRLRGGQYRVY